VILAILILSPNYSFSVNLTPTKTAKYLLFYILCITQIDTEKEKALL